MGEECQLSIGGNPGASRGVEEWNDGLLSAAQYSSVSEKRYASAALSACSFPTTPQWTETHWRTSLGPASYTRCVFRRMDANGSGDLSREEFITGLNQCGFSRFLSDEDLDKLFEQFDADGSGAIKYDEFIRAVRPRMSPRREAQVMKAFEKMDRSGDGQVTFQDIQGIYSVHTDSEYLNGQRSEKELLRHFLATFEEGGIVDGIVTKDEFLDYYAGVSASIDEDGSFDLMMRSCWKL